MGHCSAMEEDGLLSNWCCVGGVIIGKPWTLISNSYIQIQFYMVCRPYMWNLKQ